MSRKPSTAIKEEDLNAEELISSLHIIDAETDDDIDAVDSLPNDAEDAVEDYSNRRMAADDRCWDGSWLADGYMGMMIGLSSYDFEREQRKDYRDDMREGIISGTMDDHFVQFDGSSSVEYQQYQLATLRQERNLSVASGVLRTLVQGDCPSCIRITRFSNDGTSMEEILKAKQQGNQAFASGKYQDAIDSYEEALFCFPFNMFIAPVDEMKEIVTILSNKTECELRLEQLEDACSTATDALLFDADHEKTRIRRAKAELAMFSKNGSTLSHLVQAISDLKNVLECPTTATGANAAQKLKDEADLLLQDERVKYSNENPDGDFSIKVRHLSSTCW